MSTAILPIVLGLVGLVAAAFVYSLVKKAPAASGKVSTIGDQIHTGAMVFMRREYSILAIFLVVVGVLIAFSDLGINTLYAFILGAFCSGIAGYIGMYTATKANV